MSRTRSRLATMATGNWPGGTSRAGEAAARSSRSSWYWVREVQGLQLDVLGPLAQGGELDGEDVRVAVEVLAEVALGDHGVERAVGGGDDADVDGDS